METRNITVTLEKAKQWYNSDNADLKELALQVYTKDELSIPKWKNIKTFEDACKALGIYSGSITLRLNSSSNITFCNHLDAINKLNIIRKALNGDWKPSLVQGDVYYPYLRFYPDGQTAEKVASGNKDWKLGESFIADGSKYTLVVGDYNFCYCDGLADFGCGFGSSQSDLGLLGCKSKEIAMHMSQYFSREIFEAIYAYHTDTYQFIQECDDESCE